MPTDPPDACQVIFLPSGRRGRIPAGISVLEAARQSGVAIESLCGGRLTCHKCWVQVESGRFDKHGILSSPDHLTPAEAEEQAWVERRGEAETRLACAARVRGDVLLFVPEESRGQKQTIRKAAGERLIEVAPAIRQVYVVVDSAELGDHRGDWGRLQDALAQQWQLTHLSLDLPVLRRLQATLRQQNWAVTATLWQEREVIDLQAGYVEGIFGLAVDVGSTTVVAHLCDLRTSAVLATASAMNPQVVYGEDLMSRIAYAAQHPDGLTKLQQAILDTLNRLAAQAAQTAGLQAPAIQEAVLVGNTTMVQLALGMDSAELGQSPFALACRDALDFKARDLGWRLHPGAYVHVLPAEAGHVGADNVAAILAEELHHQTAVTLLVDVGTNAEIVLGNRDWLFSASSPTGPAFEGAQITHGMRAAPGAIERVRIDPQTQAPRCRVIGEPRWSDAWQTGPDAPLDRQPATLAAGICGSGSIDAVAELLLAGVLRPDGRFDPACPSPYLQWDGRVAAYELVSAENSATGRPILITQNDVRNIQLAKAALYAGARLLMRRAGVNRVDRIVLAGAFGSYVDPLRALVLGLIPDCALDNISAVGNAAGDGARIALLNRHKRDEAQALARRVGYIEIAADPYFQAEFVAALPLPHARDPFPHLAGILPAGPTSPEPARGQRRRDRRPQSPGPAE